MLLAGLAVLGGIGAYHFFPHVQKRIDQYERFVLRHFLLRLRHRQKRQSMPPRF